MPEIIDNSPGAESVAPEVRESIVDFRTDKDAPVVAYVSKMVAIPESELPENKRRGGALSAEEARELGRKKRAEIARQQALAAEGGANVAGLADSFSTTAIDDTATPEIVEETKEEAEHLIGFARIYSGTLNVGDEVYVLGPKFTPANPHAPPEPQKVKVTALYLMMGRSLEPLTSVPAGVVFGIGGLAGHVLKSGTLCSQLPGSVNLAGITMGSQPIVRVALEPENPYDLDKMIKGLKMLVESDPCAEYEVLESGEHVILTAGELHLERCLKDLRERFAKCEIQAGEPSVPYRESIVAAPEMNPPKDPNLPRGTVIGVTTSKQITVRLRVRPLPAEVTEFLGKNAAAIKRLYAERRAEEERLRKGTDSPMEGTVGEQDGMEEAQPLETGHALTLTEFKKQLEEAFSKAKGQRETWKEVSDQIIAFGPRRVGPNILIDATSVGIGRKA
jgi:ribosome assembly protein 1